tara:strand:- start:10196 stop:10978 length:783 start_codon:yes stop_codon:yes gene_type:complete
MSINYYKFYTIDKTALLCYKAIKKYANIKKKDFIIEPSAGNGSFIKYIKKISNNYKFYDIKPEHKDIVKKDYLKVTDVKNNLHIIGNPPFGKKSSLAIKFIKHSAKLNAKTISFILPISFNKPSFKKSFSTDYHLVYSKILPISSYTYKNKLVDIKTVFQIWEKRKYKRKIPIKAQPSKWYKFVKKPDCTISIKRVGFSTGKVKKCDDKDNINTNWFIKIFKNSNKTLIKKLNAFKYNTKNNVGAYSISKQDIIKKYNKI